MKIYVVTAGYCEDTVICGATPDYATAEKIYECEENKDGIKPDWVSIDDYDTDAYLPLMAGMKPYEVIMFHDGTEEVNSESVAGFLNGRVYNGQRGRRNCLVTEVYATDKEQASHLASIQMVKNSLEHEKTV